MIKIKDYNKYTNEELSDIIKGLTNLLKYRIKIVDMIKKGELTKKEIYNKRGKGPKWLRKDAPKKKGKKK